MCTVGLGKEMIVLGGKPDQRYSVQAVRLVSSPSSRRGISLALSISFLTL